MEVSPEQLVPVRARQRWGWGPWVFFAGLAGLYLWGTRPAPAPQGWDTDFAAATTVAAREHRNILVAFYMPGCVYCNMMDRSVLPATEVRAAIKGFVPVRVNMMEERELANRVGVLGAPTYAVLDAEGKLLTKTEGYQPVDRFVQFLSHAATLPAPGLARAGRAP